jgi:hypothetical protein
VQTEGFAPWEQDFWKGLNHRLNGLVRYCIYTKHFWIYLPNLSYVLPFGITPRPMSPTPGKYQRSEVGPSNSPQCRKVSKERAAKTYICQGFARCQVSAVGGVLEASQSRRSFQHPVPEKALGSHPRWGVLSGQSRDWSMWSVVSACRQQGRFALDGGLCSHIASRSTVLEDQANVR